MLRRLPRAAAIFQLLPVIAVAGSGIIQVTGVRSWSHADSTRVILETTGPAEFRADSARNPDRLFFDIPHSRPWIGQRRHAVRAVSDSLVLRVRIAETVPGTTRVVFDLTGPAEFTVTKLVAPDRMVIEIRPRGKPKPVAARSVTSRREDPPTFVEPPAMAPAARRHIVLAGSPPVYPLVPLNIASAADVLQFLASLRPPVLPAPKGGSLLRRPPETRLTANVSTAPVPTVPLSYDNPARLTRDASAPPPENASRTLTRALGLKVSRIVIDAGHGGHDDGTIGPSGILEKDVVLDVALRLSKLVQSRMGAEVVLTRSDDTFLPLQERTSIANQRRADLFLSIHANSSPAPGVAGTETFFLNFTNSSTALDVAARENAGSDKTVGELRDLIQSITLNDKIAESQTFAQDIQNSIFLQASRSNAAARNRGVKRAPFVVLIGASMPSILAEIGFLSNARDEANLKKPEYRQKIAEALYKGLSRYSQSLNHLEVARGPDRSEKPVGVGLN